MEVNFAKMSGCGNDFIVIDNRKKIVKNPSRFAIKYCHRKKGIGADGLLLVENPSARRNRRNFRMRYFNSDGSHASFCGNGARCIAFFAYRKKIASKKMRFESDAGSIPAEIKGCNVKLKMPKPKDIKLDFTITVEGKKYNVSFADIGVPHIMVFMKDIKNIDIDNLGRKIRHHKEFRPAGTNVNLIKVINKNKLQIRTYERGVEGETLACGTGAVASSIVSVLKGYVSSPVSVLTRGGEILKVYYDNPSAGKVYLEGKVDLVFENKIRA
ncbi:MAG: diaminopimelate epimerase [Elusimicrobia bacterium]|nr:diaminopimelate epimerase [Elusimicrobiota bacterium]